MSNNTFYDMLLRGYTVDACLRSRQKRPQEKEEVVAKEKVSKKGKDLSKPEIKAPRRTPPKGQRYTTSTNNKGKYGKKEVKELRTSPNQEDSSFCNTLLRGGTIDECLRSRPEKPQERKSKEEVSKKETNKPKRKAPRRTNPQGQRYTTTRTNNVGKQKKRKATRKKRKIKEPHYKGHNSKRYTSPEYRNIFKRISLQRKYNKGLFDEIEEAYNKGIYGKNEVEQLRTSSSEEDIDLYRQIQNYEDMLDDIEARDWLKGFKRTMAGLGLTALVSLTVLAGVLVKQEVERSQERKNEHSIVYQVENATEEEREAAANEIEEIENEIGYEFTALTDDEKVGAVIRMKFVLKYKIEATFKSYLYTMRDQEYLEMLLNEAYEGEFDSFSTETQANLKEIAYMELGDFKKYMRDPDKVGTITESKGEDSYEIGD